MPAGDRLPKGCPILAQLWSETRAGTMNTEGARRPRVLDEEISPAIAAEPVSSIGHVDAMVFRVAPIIASLGRALGASRPRSAEGQS